MIYNPEILQNYTRLNVLDVVSALQIFSISRKYRLISCSVLHQLMSLYSKCVRIEDCQNHALGVEPKAGKSPTVLPSLDFNHKIGR